MLKIIDSLFEQLKNIYELRYCDECECEKNEKLASLIINFVKDLKSSDLTEEKIKKDVIWAYRKIPKLIIDHPILINEDKLKLLKII